jgi:hypothetical protein
MAVDRLAELGLDNRPPIFPANWRPHKRVSVEVPIHFLNPKPHSGHPPRRDSKSTPFTVHPF